jgi:hypothetical protein
MVRHRQTARFRDGWSSDLIITHRKVRLWLVTDILAYPSTPAVPFSAKLELALSSTEDTAHDVTAPAPYARTIVQPRMMRGHGGENCVCEGQEFHTESL